MVEPDYSYKNTMPHMEDVIFPSIGGFLVSPEYYAPVLVNWVAVKELELRYHNGYFL